MYRAPYPDNALAPHAPVGGPLDRVGVLIRKAETGKQAHALPVLLPVHQVDQRITGLIHSHVFAHPLL